MSFKPSGATLNDVAGRIRPSGLVFDVTGETQVELEYQTVKQSYISQLYATKIIYFTVMFQALKKTTLQ